MIISLLAKLAEQKQEHGSGDDVGSKPRKAVIFLMEMDKEIQEKREMKMSKALSGFSGCRMSGRSNAEGGKEGKEEEDEGRQVEKELMMTVLAAAICLERYERNTNVKKVPAADCPGNHFNMRVKVGTIRRWRTTRRKRVRWTDS